MNSVFIGKKLKLTIFGGSHEPEIGFFLDGLPSTKIEKKIIFDDINRRRPSVNKVGTTKRIEADEPIFISGYNGFKTSGKRIEIRFKNTNVKSTDYRDYYDHPRPGHADFVSRMKYGDSEMIKGGGIFSGRMTLPMVVVGSLCKQVLNYQFKSTLDQIGTLTDMSEIDDYLINIEKDGDSVGGIVKVVVKGVPIGVGGPLFDRLSAKIAQTVLSIPGTKGIEFGAGFNSTNLLGSAFNDVILDQSGQTKTNHNGGISGGISDGNDLIIRVAFRPPSSIRKTQESYSFKTDNLEKLEIKGRHDVSYLSRVLVVVEAMVALTLLDETL